MRYRDLKPRFIIAYGPFKWFLKRYGYVGITMPWLSIYVLEDWINDRQLRRHELVHIAQMRREGPVLMCIKYLYYNIKVGYRNNPYEVEARRIAGR